MSRLFSVVVALVLLVSCFADTAYDTTYVLKVQEQLESSGDYTPLEGTKAYAFEGTTSEWGFESYDDALLGVITSLETGEQKGAFTSSQPYEGSSSDLVLQLDRESVVLVLVDPASEVYAYTNYTVPINFDEVLVDIVFRTWKDSSYTASTWTFIVPESDDEAEEENEEEEEEEEEEETEDESEDEEDQTEDDTTEN